MKVTSYLSARKVAPKEWEEMPTINFDLPPEVIDEAINESILHSKLPKPSEGKISLRVVHLAMALKKQYDDLKNKQNHAEGHDEKNIYNVAVRNLESSYNEIVKTYPKYIKPLKDA